MLQPICDLCKEPIADFAGIVVHKAESDCGHRTYLSLVIQQQVVNIEGRDADICPKCLIKAVMELGKED